MPEHLIPEYQEDAMESLYLLIPVAAVFCAIVIALFIWSVDSKQFDDLDREASRILEEDDRDKPA
jgi:cbb3-type cytochrome oxidase maturation protein